MKYIYILTTENMKIVQSSQKILRLLEFILVEMIFEVKMVVFWAVTLCELVGSTSILEEHTISIFNVEAGSSMFLWCWYPPTSSRHNPEDQQ
jgi:hypothetical protein